MTTFISNSKPHVGAIDVGHGHLKGRMRIAEGTSVHFCHPSFVGTNTMQGNRMTGLPDLQVVPVQVGDRSFLVGKDSDKVRAAGSDRNRDPGYSATPEYHALMLGALWEFRQPVIDVLVVGLPLSTLPLHKDRLQRQLQGTHTVPSFDDPFSGKSQSVEVKRVVVLGQPMGAFIHAMSTDNELAYETVLSLDMGYNTLDMLVVNNGKPMPGLADAQAGGMAGFLDEMARVLGQKIAEQHPDLPERIRITNHVLEASLQTGRNVRTQVGPFAVADLIEAAQSKLDQYMQMVAAKLGESRSEITSVVLSGGGAPIMVNAFKRQFPAIKRIIMSSDPQFDVVSGYQMMGEQLAKKSSEVTHGK